MFITNAMIVGSSKPTLDTSLVNGLLANWSFDDSANGMLETITNTTRNAAISGSVTFSSGSYVSAGNGYVSIPTNSTTNSDLYNFQKFTVSTWLKINNNSSNYQVWQFGAFNGYSPTLTLSLSNGNAGVSLAHGVTGTSLALPSAVLQTNTWYHISVTFDGTTIHGGTGKFKLFLNGVLKAETDITDNNSSLQWGSSEDRKILFGTRGTFDQLFNGSINEISVWNRPLSEQDIWKLYSRGNIIKYPFLIPLTDKGILSYYKFNTSTLNYDTVTNQPLGNVVSTTNTFNQATFNGTSSYIHQAAPSSIYKTTELSVFARISPTTTSGIRVIFHVSDRTVNYSSGITFRISNGFLQCGIGKGVGSEDLISTNTAIISPINWLHVGMTLKDNIVKLYYMGSLVKEATYTGNLSWVDGYIRSTIGALASSSGFSSYYAGKIDELTYWNFALSSAQISSLYSEQDAMTIV